MGEPNVKLLSACPGEVPNALSWVSSNLEKGESGLAGTSPGQISHGEQVPDEINDDDVEGE